MYAIVFIGQCSYHETLLGPKLEQISGAYFIYGFTLNVSFLRTCVDSDIGHHERNRQWHIRMESSMLSATIFLCTNERPLRGGAVDHGFVRGGFLMTCT